MKSSERGGKEADLIGGVACERADGALYCAGGLVQVGLRGGSRVLV